MLPTLEKVQGAQNAGDHLGLVLQTEKLRSHAELAQTSGAQIKKDLDSLEAFLASTGQLGKSADVAPALAALDAGLSEADRNTSDGGFDDATGAMASFKPVAPGLHLVTVRASDGANDDFAKHLVDVAAAPCLLGLDVGGELLSLDRMAENIGVTVRIESSDFDTSNVRVFKLAGRDTIGQLFQYDVDVAVFGREGLALDAVVGARVTLAFERDDLELCRRHGVVARVIDHLETEGEARTYRLAVVPSLHASTLVETQEVFVDTAIPDIVKQKLDLVNIDATSRDLRLLGTYAERDLVNQYRETDLAFISRHCEHLGISIFFEHGETRDKVVLTDHAAGFPALEEPLHFRPRGDKVDVFELSRSAEVIPRSYVVYDYNYRAPRVDLSATFEVDGFAGGVAEYGVHTKTPEESAQIARVRAEERKSRQLVYEGASDVCTLRAGVRFTLQGHAVLEGAELLVVEIEHEASQPVHLHGAPDQKPSYRNRFRAIPTDRTYRPPRRTPWPRIWGVVTGVVEPNPEGSVEDYARLDEHGRYQIQFHFDLAPPGRPRPSRWVRMAQPHSGPNYGMHFPLKPGVEVACVFVDGDPDRPMIVATVPNPTTRSPVTRTESRLNRIVTRSGVILEIDDGIA